MFRLIIIVRFVDNFVRFVYNENEPEHTINMKGAHIMIVTATEFKTNLGKYLEMAMKQDIFITKNGKNIARLTSPTVNKLAVLDSLAGIVPKDSAMDEDSIREERLRRQ